MLIEMMQKARELSLPVYSITEYDAKTGKMVTDGFTRAHVAHAVYSVSKTFSATAALMLVSDGELSFDDTVYDILHPKYPDICDDKWKGVTVGNVLSQTTGIGHGFLDLDGDNAANYPTRDYLKMVLSAGFAYEPGTKMVYSDSNFYLISRIVHAASGKYMQDLLRERLFNPLDFQSWAWAVCPEGHALGGTGLCLRSVDMAKLGAVYLGMGEYKGIRFLSEDVVRTATSPKTKYAEGRLYGHSFWMNEGDIRYEANGMYGQHIFIMPADGRVVAWNAYDPDGKNGPLHDIIRANSK